MAEEQNGGIGGGINIIERETGSLEDKRNKIRFKRADSGAGNESFRDRSTTESSPRRQARIPREKQTTVTISDTRPEDSKKVKGKPPELPVEEEQPKRRPGRPKSLKPTLDDSINTAKFLLSAIEIAAVTATGPQGEMTEWERGIIQAPLQRIIHRTPVGIVEKGGLFIDAGFLTIGLAVYLARVSKGLSMPKFLEKKKVIETQEDIAAPVAARATDIVDTVKPGDKDGLAVPIPSVINQYMNGAI